MYVIIILPSSNYGIDLSTGPVPNCPMAMPDHIRSDSLLMRQEAAEEPLPAASCLSMS